MTDTKPRVKVRRTAGWWEVTCPHSGRFAKCSHLSAAHDLATRHARQHLVDHRSCQEGDLLP